MLINHYENQKIYISVIVSFVGTYYILLPMCLLFFSYLFLFPFVTAAFAFNGLNNSFFYDY